MRILISNPDGIGDLVLRQPLFAALTDAGHQLALVVRSEAAPLVKWLAPEAQTFQLGSSPFRPHFDGRSEPIQQLVCELQAFAPDIFVIAPYQRTVFDELVAESLQGTRVFGFNGYLYRGDIGAGLDVQSTLRMTATIPVSIDMHEVRKAERLCSALLERSVTLPEPRISPQPDDVEPASTRLMQMGLAPGRFWTACVGNSPYNTLRNWGLDSWAALLRHFVEVHGQPILLTGTPDEWEATEEIRSLMGDAADHALNLCQSGDPLETLVGLSALSAGYIGRDTGPMHIAAALSKPVLAVFGAGNWPRFTPMARRGVVFTVKLDCAGCNYLCHLSDSYCIKRVPVRQVVDGLDELVRGTVAGLVIHALEPDRELTAHIIREASLLSTEKERRAAADRQQVAALRARDDQQQKAIKELAEGLQRESQERSTAKTALDLARTEAGHYRSAIRLVEEAHERERQSAIEAQVRLSDRLRLNENRLRLAQIDERTARSNAAKQRDTLLRLVGDCGREMRMLVAERDQLARPVEVKARSTGRPTPPPELPLLDAVRIAISRIREARGRRLREVHILAGAAGARLRRQLGSGRNR